MNENVNLNEPKIEPVMENKKDPSNEKKPVAAPNKMQIEMLTYFGNLPVNRQLELLEKQGIDVVKIFEGVSNHRKEARSDNKIAIERAKAEQSLTKADSKRELLESRYEEDIKEFAAAGLSSKMIAMLLTEREQSNFPKRPKNWNFAPGLISQFMKDNDIKVVKK